MLPVSLRPWAGLLAPCIGYAFLLVFSYIIVRNLAGIPVVLLVIIPLAGILNVIALRRTGPPRIRWPLRHYLERLPLLALLFVTMLVGSAPLVSYGYPTIVSENWDFEYYLPVARYLERGPVTAIQDAPPNPLRDLNAKPASIGIGHTLGISIWQGSVDTISGSEALASLNPVLAWLRMLGIAAVYVLFRATFGLRRGPALLGAAFVSAGALLLWVSYFNFGMQMSAWPLLPLGLVLSISAVEEAAVRRYQAWPALLVAAICVAALPVAYQPASALFLPLLGGLLVSLFVRSHHRLRILASAASLGVAALLLSVLPLVDYAAGFSPSALETFGVVLGLSSYLPPTDILGFTPFLWQMRPVPPVPFEAMAALGLMSALMLVGLVLSPRRASWFGLALGAVIYLAWLRFGQQFAYGYMKSAAYLAFPFVGLAAAGVQAILVRRVPVAPKVVVGAAALVLLGLMVPAQGRIVADNWGKPDLFAAEVPALFELRSHVPPGSRVRLTPDSRIAGPLTGLVANLLDHASLVGEMSTGYVRSWASAESTSPVDFTLLLQDEDPAAWGISRNDRVWSGGSFVLYRRARDVVAHLLLDRTLSPGQSLDLSIGADSLAEGSQLQGGESRRFTITMFAFHPAKLLVDGKPFNVNAGASVFEVGATPTPRKLVIKNNGTSEAIIRWATLWTSDTTGQSGPDTETQAGTVVAQASSVAEGSSVNTTLNILLPQIKPVTLAIDIWDRQGSVHYGWYGIRQITPGETNTFDLKLDLISGRMQGRTEGGVDVPVDAQFAGLQRGDYMARLNLFAGTELLGAPVDLFSFSIRQGAVSDLQGWLSAPLVMTATGPAVPLTGRAGEDALLAGYTLGSAGVWPGQQVSLTLWWKPTKEGLDERSVLLHLVDASGKKYAQADGPPAGGDYPTSKWKPSDTVIDRHTVDIPRDLLPGNYNLAIGMYHFPSIEIVPMFQDDKRLSGDVLLIPVTVKGW